MSNSLVTKLLFTALLVSIGVTSGWAQGVNSEIQAQNQKLEKLRKEIDQFREDLQTAEKKEQSLLEQLNNLEKQVSYTSQLIRQMEQTRQARQRQIATLNSRMDENERRLSRLKEQFARRVVRIYKQGEYEDFELLLTAQSLNQALIRYKYLKIINDADRKMYSAIRSTMDSIQSDKQSIQAAIAAQNRLIREKQQEQQRMKTDQQQRQKLLASVQKDQRSIREAIQEREEAAKELRTLITKLEEKKAREERQRQLARQRQRKGIEPTTNISGLKGKLPWPAVGEVVAKFGRYQHPKLKTVTENTGIDIAAKKGTEVAAVLDGLVTTITWIRGYGTTIIVDHGAGFYTVYTHVIDVRVNTNNYVSTGDVIAHVGDSGSLDGAKLHFEIWGNKEKLNPEVWLTKL